MLRLWNFSVSKLRSVMKNYNVIERAEKALESEKRVPPRHPGTEVKFQVLIKDNPGITEEMKKKDLELLNRLKIVKVASEGASEDYNKSKRPLPQQRRHHGMPDFGYEEPKIIPEGKCTLRQVLEFLSNHQNDPEKYSVEAIAKAYSMKSSDVENIIEYFRVFELYISREEKTSVAKAAVQNLGVGKVVKPLYHSKFKHLEQEKFVTHTQGEKKE